MADLEKVIKGLECHRERTVCVNEEGEVCPYFSYEDCHRRLTDDALELLKAQNEVISSLVKLGYPHNFQREKPWIVNYMLAITEVVRKAVHLRNGNEPPKEGDGE